MAIRSRQNRMPDLGRLVAGIRGPNVDTRLWTVLAYALDDSFVDEEHGVFVDVKCFPGGEEFTCRVGSEYAGAKFGLYTGSIKKDDELEISIPLGDPAEGPIVSRRLWSAADPPPELVKDHPDDIVLVLEKDRSLRVKIGDFTVEIDASVSPTVARFKTDDGDVFKLTKDGLELGVTPDDKMALAQLVKDEVQKVIDALNDHIGNYNGHKHMVNGVKTMGSPVAQTQTVPVNSEATMDTSTDASDAGDVNSEFVKST